MFNSLSSCQIVFQSDSTILYAHQQCGGVQARRPSQPTQENQRKCSSQVFLMNTLISPFFKLFFFNFCMYFWLHCVFVATHSLSLVQ